MDDGQTTGSFEIDMKKNATVNYVLLQEYIALGQRVSSFTVEAWKDNSWQSVAAGTTIGYKRILKIDPVTTSKIRVSITGAKACPLISNTELY
jgi:alpha-L-fucosidase